MHQISQTSTEKRLCRKSFAQRRFTQKSVYTKDLLQWRAFRQKSVYTQELLLTEGNACIARALAQRSFCTSFSHRMVFTYRNSHTEKDQRYIFREKISCTETCLPHRQIQEERVRNNFYTEERLPADLSNGRVFVGAFTQKSVYTAQKLYSKLFAHRSFTQKRVQTQKLLRSQRSFCIDKLLQRKVCTPTQIIEERFTEASTHTASFTEKNIYPLKLLQRRTCAYRSFKSRRAFTHGVLTLARPSFTEGQNSLHPHKL